jgi:hypothetical protein
MRNLLLIGSAILLMGAGSPDPEFGASVRNNVAVQTVDMNPKYQGALVEGGLGERSVAAVKRYQEGKIRPLAQVSGTSAVGAQGGAAAKQN